MSKTGGACFTPRLAIRPEYPNVFRVIVQSTREYTRDILFGSVLVVALAPMHTAWAEAVVPRVGDRAFFTIFGGTVHLLTFLLMALPLVLFEDRLKKYKIDRKTSQKPSSRLLRSLWIEMLINHLISTPLVIYLTYDVFLHFGMPQPQSYPDVRVGSLCKAFAIAHLCNDVGFYWSHRLLHTPYLYKRIHKKHHSFVGTIAPAAEFSHVLESFLANTLPTIAGVLFTGQHCLIVWIWLAIRLQQTYETHSGFCFNNTWANYFLITHADAAIEHDHHHTINRGNFGALWLDYICGTMDSFAAAGGHETYLELAHKAATTASSSLSTGG